MTENPWILLSVPARESDISARRVSAAGRWDFFWACDHERRSMLVLNVPDGTITQERLPRLRGIEVLVEADAGPVAPRIIWRLKDPALRDIFYRLCVDIMRCAEAASTEVTAAKVALSRTWRWHHLMRGGGADVLSAEEQKGLIGELLVLERFLLPKAPAAKVLSAWRGPLGESRDFKLGRLAIESKAHSNDVDSAVRISSEYQLDDHDVDALYLHVVIIEPSKQDDQDSVTLQSVADRIGDSIKASDPSALPSYRALLLAAGVRPEDDYSTLWFTIGRQKLFRVHGSFPRLIPSQLPAGVERVNYSLSLSSCSDYFAYDESVLLAVEKNADDE